MKLIQSVRTIIEDEATGFRDALYHTPEEFAALSKEDLEAQAQARVDAHAERLANPPKLPEPTADDKANEIVALEDQIRMFAERKAALEADPAVASKVRERESARRV